MSTEQVPLRPVPASANFEDACRFGGTGSVSSRERGSPWPQDMRFVTNAFMYTGGDGYTVFGQGTNVLQPGDDLQLFVNEYIAANSPVGPVVEGRIVGP